MKILRLLFSLAIFFQVVPAQPLNGTYTVHPLQPASSRNFVSLVDVTDALCANGISGPVTFEVFDDAGPYFGAPASIPFSPFCPAPPPAIGHVIRFSLWAGSSPANRVTFRAAPGERPVLDATGRQWAVSWDGASDTTLEGFELRGASYEAILFQPQTTNDRIRISGCHIHSCGGSGIALNGFAASVADAVIENCYFHDLLTSAFSSAGTGMSVNGYVSTRRANRFFVYLEPNSLLSLLGTGFGPFPFSLASGAGSLALPIPLLPSLSGTDVAIQAAIPDPVTASAFTLTNAALVRIR